MASKKLKQLQLGASEDGHLQLSGPVIENAIEDLTADITRPWVPSGEDFLLKIPDELLSEIIAFAITPPHYEWPRNYYGRALALTKVCQRLNRLVQPHLYHSIHFENSCSFVPPCLPTRRFYRTLKADPSLGRFCKELKIYVSDIPGVKSIHDYDLANELLCWLPNVTSFDLQGGFNGANGPALWAMVQRAVKHMPLIRHVSICREDVAGLLMTPIIEHLNLPLLKTLDIHGVSGVTNDGNDRQEHFGAQPVKGYERTASFTNLVISDFMEDPAALAHLLAWPKLIQHFTFRRIHFNRAHWDLDIMQSLLSPYKSTLKTIAIGSLSGRAAGSINVSSFHELITLNLSRWQLDCTPEIACATLLAPKLHTFVWDFGIYDQHSEGWGHFAQPQADWILKFAQLAAARKSTLRIIEILFTPDQWSAPSTREQYEAVGYPWDRMDDLKISMKPLRIELKYSPGPSHTKEEVEKRIEEIEAEEAKKANVADIRRMLD